MNFIMNVALEKTFKIHLASPFFRHLFNMHYVYHTLDVTKYSRPSVARTLMARLPLSNSFLSPLEQKPIDADLG